jgi:hypothetical protein
MPKFVQYSPVDATLERATYIPTNIFSTGQLSLTSSAYTCFTKQKFSADLQAFMVNYVLSIQSYYTVYK